MTLQIHLILHDYSICVKVSKKNLGHILNQAIDYRPKLWYLKKKAKTLRDLAKSIKGSERS